MTKVVDLLNSRASDSDMDTGLEASYRKDMSQTLSDILGQTYQLTITSHIYHWNVVGPLFKPLHELTEAHYNDLFAAADVIAERIRALGHLAPSSFSDVTAFTPNKSEVNATQAGAMVEDLIGMHENIVKSMRKAGERAGEQGDMVTEDMLTARLAFHEKALWMLRSVIAQ